MTFRKIRCRCGWVSPEEDSLAIIERGVPWYCDDCGERVHQFVMYEDHERAIVKARGW